MVGVCRVYGDGCRLDHTIVVRNIRTRWLKIEVRTVSLVIFSEVCFYHQAYEADSWNLNVGLGTGE